MSSRSIFVFAVTLLILVAATGATFAADVLKNVPREAMAFVVVKNLAASDAKVEKLLSAMQLEFPPPLAFLQAVTGIREGLNPQGDVLLAVLAGASAPDPMPQFAVWLPVSDYAQFIKPLGGSPAENITAVTIAGEDVLIGNAQGWALVMDPNQRERMERLLTETANLPAEFARWRSWIEENDVTLVAFPKGVRTFLGWAATAPPEAQIHPQEGTEDSPFDFGQASNADTPFAAADEPASASGLDAKHWTMVRRWTTAAPQLTQAVLRARFIGCALRLDEDGNLHSALRLHGFHDHARDADAVDGDEHAPLPPALFQGGPFVLHAAGNPPPMLVSSAVRIYIQAAIDDLKTEANMQLRDATVHQFQQAADRAASGVESIHLLTQPGQKQEGIYTNDFLVVRAESARTFADNAKDLMRLWNSMNRDAEAGTRLVFDVEETKLGDRTATQYSLDIAAADGAPALPEIRQAMEKLFGPGGKLRLWIVPVDEKNVLLASATPEQVTSALHVLDRKQPIDWSAAELAAVNPLLPDDSDWRLYFSPHHYNIWQRRKMDAITGPVLGGPLVKEFPAAPPLGVAGALREAELRIEAAVPAATLQSAGTYLKN